MCCKCPSLIVIDEMRTVLCCSGLYPSLDEVLFGQLHELSASHDGSFHQSLELSNDAGDMLLEIISAEF